MVSQKIFQEIDNKLYYALSAAHIGGIYLKMAKEPTASATDKTRWLEQSIQYLENATSLFKLIGPLDYYQSY